MQKSPWTSNASEPMPEAPPLDADDVAEIIGTQVLEVMKQITAKEMDDSALSSKDQGTALLLVLKGMIESCTVALRATGKAIIKESAHKEYDAKTKRLLHGITEDAFSD